MLRLQPRPKTRRVIPVPEELREALSEALEIIREAKRDPHVFIDYDDAIQVAKLCGGRVGTKQHPYEFTYYAGDQGVKERWSLAFHRLEIEDIVEGALRELVFYCCETPGCGHASNRPDIHCSCDYVKDPHYGNFEFPAAGEALEHWGVRGISQDSTRADVIARLGEPTLTGGGVKSELSGYINPWIKYHRPDCQLRFEFKTGKLSMVSVMEADWEPGNDIPKRRRRKS